MKVVLDRRKWLRSVTPALWRLRQKGCNEFEVRLGRVRPCFKTKEK